MKKLSLIAALLLGATPVAAQSVQQPLGTSGEINNSTLTNTGVICIEEMVATFCNVPTGPNLNGYGSRGSVGSSTVSSSSAPVVSAKPPPNHRRIRFTHDGECLEDLVTESGEYIPGDAPGPTLKKFFSRLYGSCGLSRGDWQDA